MSGPDLTARIQRRAAKAGVAPGSDVAAAAAAYLTLLSRWNEKINLTGFDLSRPTDDAIDRLIVEPFAAVKYVARTDHRVLDVGSGGGSPALLLKLARPDLAFVLVESKVRKAAFLREAVRQLALQEVDVENCRIEELVGRSERREWADIVTVRAVRVDPKRLWSLSPLMRPAGRLFVFAGSETGLAARAAGSVQPLVPSLESRLLILNRNVFG